MINDKTMNWGRVNSLSPNPDATIYNLAENTILIIQDGHFDPQKLVHIKC
jgi:hypothetical protein